MDMIEHRVRERAYYIWEEEGCVSGRAEAHWIQAEGEFAATIVETAAVADVSAVKAAPKAPRAKAAPKAAKAVAAKAPAKAAAKPRKTPRASEAGIALH